MARFRGGGEGLLAGPGCAVAREVAEALGYLPEIDPVLRRRFDMVLGTLVRLVGGH